MKDEITQGTGDFSLASAKSVQFAAAKETPGKGLPLSFAQERLFFLQQIEPKSWHYNVPIVLELEGSLDVEIIERALLEVVRRHEILRTTFDVTEGEPIQIAGLCPERILAFLNLEGLQTIRRDEEVQHLTREQACTPFDLIHGPLLRASLLRISEREHRLVVVMHHIIVDGWSAGVFIGELCALYVAYSKGLPSPLPALVMQYAEYAVWQREQFRREGLEKQSEYWKKQLENLEVLELPADYARPPVQTFRGASQRLELPNQLTSLVKALSRKERVTLFVTLLAAFQALLYRYSGRNDIAVGTPVANRNRTEIENLIGFFANTLIVRAKLSGAASFRDLLRQVQSVMESAYPHQAVPFEKVVEALKPERDLSRTPLFQIWFSLRSATGSGFKLPSLEACGLKLKIADVDNGSSKFDLGLLLVDEAQNLSCTVEYSTDLFEGSTIRRLVEHFKVLLEAAVAHPEQAINALPLLSAAERDLLVRQWSSGEIHEPGVECPSDFCLQQLFEAQVERRATAVAVVFGKQTLSYGELNERANQVAHYVRRHGVKEEARVGVLMERGLEMVIAVLGIVKAGGAYVPLDTNYPETRLRYMLEDAGVEMVLTHGGLKSMEVLKGKQVLCVDEEWAEVAGESLENPAVVTQPMNLAYVIYTSGSTGEPKGTEVPHASIPGFIFGVEYVRFDEETVMLQHSSLSWDALTLELWPALLRGGRCVLCEERMLSGGELGKYTGEYGVNTLWLTAALFHALLEDGGVDLGGVKQLMVGGEAPLAGRVEEAQRRWPGMRMVNGYGPSECTVFSNCHVMRRPVEVRAHGIAIGKPIGDRRVYVLDERGELAPVGVEGEIYIGGVSVARGYLRRPELTAEKFVPDGWSGRAGGRLYRTGDRGRWRGDGEMEFCGRQDGQVKVRGFRVELGEVEAALGNMEEVRQAAVVVREDRVGEKRIIGYVESGGGADAGAGYQLEGSELRRRLAQILPEHLLPAMIVVMDALPRTATGKIDRQALPTLGSVEASSQVIELPQTELERGLVEIWQRVLEREAIGINQNFFDLGGNSLLLLRLCSFLQTRYSAAISIVDLFRHSSIKSLAEYLSTKTDQQLFLSESVERATSRKAARALRQSAR